jgi:hypothetical protein
MPCSGVAQGGREEHLAVDQGGREHQAVDHPACHGSAAGELGEAVIGEAAGGLVLCSLSNASIAWLMLAA